MSLIILELLQASYRLQNLEQAIWKSLVDRVSDQSIPLRHSLIISETHARDSAMLNRITERVSKILMQPRRQIPAPSSTTEVYHLGNNGTLTISFFSAIMHYSRRQKQETSLWIFGYGSLIWNPGFEFHKSHKAYAVGFARRMYQGNAYHRGDTKLPGRVATMIEQPTSTTNGVAFRVDGPSSIRKAIEHLKEREVDNGYEFVWIPLRVLMDDGKVVPIRALTCIASTSNEYYLGPDEVEKMAHHIIAAKGRAGPNVEYVLKLAEHVRELFPRDHDDHLYQLEFHIRSVQAVTVSQ